MTNRLIPDTIRIMGIDFATSIVNDLHCDGEDADAEIDVNECTIRVDDSLSNPQSVRLALWHEIIHGMLQLTGFVREGENEVLVQCIALGVYQVLRDNPNLRAAGTCEPCRCAGAVEFENGEKGP